MKGQSFVVQCDATDAEMRQFLKKYKISTERRCHVIDDQSNIAMVEAGLGISIMPRMLLRSCTAAVRKKTVAVVIFVLDVHLAQLAAEGHCIIARRDCPAHRLPFCRCLSPGQCQPGRKSCTANQRFTEITSFHGLSPLLLS